MTIGYSKTEDLGRVGFPPLVAAVSEGGGLGTLVPSSSHCCTLLTLVSHKES